MHKSRRRTARTSRSWSMSGSPMGWQKSSRRMQPAAWPSMTRCRLSASNPTINNTLHVLYAHIWEVPSSILLFSKSLLHSHSVHSPFSSHLAFPLREPHQRRFCLFSFYSVSYTFFFSIFLLHFSVKGWYFWERGTLGLMFNRCGTSGTNARLSRAEVTSPHVFSPDCFVVCFLNLCLIFIYFFY